MVALLPTVALVLVTAAAGQENAAELERCDRILAESPRDVPALVGAGRALIAMRRYGEAADRLSAAGVSNVDVDALLAAASYLAAENAPRLQEARTRRQTAAAAADRALRSGSSAKTLHAIRTLSLKRVGSFDAAEDAARAWLAADVESLVARSTLRDIESSRERWAPLGTVPASETPALEHRRRSDVESLVKKLGPKSTEAVAVEADRLLVSVTDRGLRVQLIVLRLATRGSVGAAMLAALDALDAGWIDEKSALPLLRAVRRLDPSLLGEDRLYLDGATPPKLIDPSVPDGTRPTSTPPGTRVAVELLIRIEADGSVGPIVPLVAGPNAVRARQIERLRSSRYMPAVRDGLPVAVPVLECALVSHGEVTVFGQVR